MLIREAGGGYLSMAVLSGSETQAEKWILYRSKSMIQYGG